MGISRSSLWDLRSIPFAVALPQQARSAFNDGSRLRKVITTKARDEYWAGA
jgi:hypothetical protein